MAGVAISLEGRTALVTGAGRGIGRAIAVRLMEAGADLVATGTRIESDDGGLAGVAAREGRRLTRLNADLSRREEVMSLVERCDAGGLAVDILVNNAGIIRRADAERHGDADWDAVMAVNLDAPFLLAREFGARMLSRRGGKIVFLASVLSFQGGLRVPGYAATKGAVAQLAKALANEWASRGVNVNAVAPGYVATDNTRALQQDARREAELLARVPAGRWGTPEEIADPVLFLCSDLARFLHGVVLPADGGWLAR